MTNMPNTDTDLVAALHHQRRPAEDGSP